MAEPAHPAPQDRRATMRDVAQRAGVGIKTVSRVLNGEPHVTEATAQRVRAAVHDLDYQIDLQARSLRRADGRTRTVGLLVGSVDNPFAGAIHRGVEDAAMAHSVAVFASSFDDEPAREDAAVRGFLQRRVDGLILMTTRRHPTYLDTLRERGVPVVFVDREPELVDCDSVASDNREGAAAATAHLLHHGHRRIALLTDRTALQTARARHAGYQDAMSAAGLIPLDDHVVMGIHDTESARVALARMLRSAEPPTAVLSAQNLITVGALHALRDAGAQHATALVGFDDFPLADLIEPGVSVVAQDAHAIGRIAAERLFARIDGDTAPTRHTVVPTRFIPRGSGEIVAPR